MRDEIREAGLRALVFELDDLRCALGEAEYGEKLFTREQITRMQQRIAELEAVLDEDDVIAVLSEGDAYPALGAPRRATAGGLVPQ
jgi:hypothetical protein